MCAGCLGVGDRRPIALFASSSRLACFPVRDRFSARYRMEPSVLTRPAAPSRGLRLKWAGCRDALDIFACASALISPGGCTGTAWRESDKAFTRVYELEIGTLLTLFNAHSE